MAKLTIDLSGRGGLVERYQGDLNDTSSQPNLRYLGQEGQFAEGIFNPFKEYGFMHPANAKYATLTGTVAAGTNSIQYDPEDDIVYLSENGENILQLSSLSDTSLANYHTITSGDDIKDMLLYEINSQKALIYVIDSNDTLVSTTPKTGMYVGYKFIDSTDYIPLIEKDVFSETSGVSTSLSVVRDADASGSSSNYRRFAQSFQSEDLADLTVTGVEVAIARNNIATPSGVTVKVSIQGNDTKADGPYTDQGAWTTSTAYAINDVVSNGGKDYNCIEAHTSSASDEPGVGGNWETYWNEFIGSPDGSDVASVSITADNLPAISGGFVPSVTELVFSSSVTLTDNTQYWLVVEESGANLLASESVDTKHTSGNTAKASAFYPNNQIMGEVTSGATDYWENWNQNRDNYNTMHFKFTQNEGEDWSKTTASGSFGQATGQTSFMYLADNALVYWVVGRNVHTIDGGGTGGSLGRVNQNVLTFPSYINVVDIAETRSRMYLGIQTSDKTTSSDDRTFVARRSGIYVWDRRSQVVGGSDFYPTPGAKEIKALFTSSDGSVKAITVGNSGFTEIRAASGNQFAVIHTLEKDAYPKTRRSISQVDQLSVWLGANGKWYAFGSVVPGEPQRLYKIGDMSGEANAGLVTGPIFVGHEEATEPRLAVLFGWTDSDPSYIVQKWYPNGDGTISAVAQTGEQGDAYTQVIPVPSLSNVNYINIFGIPTTTDSSDDVANIKIYFNMSSTPWATKVVTKADMNKGYYEIPVNKQNVNFLQIEVEWPTDETLGADTFRPMYAEVDYSPVETAGGKTT